jgi:transcriptional regulator with XRE-family HTH domain
MTQAQLAEATGLKQSAIARIEGARVIPRIDTIYLLVKTLGLKLDIVIDEEAVGLAIV